MVCLWGGGVCVGKKMTTSLNTSMALLMWEVLERMPIIALSPRSASQSVTRLLQSTTNPATVIVLLN